MTGQVVFTGYLGPGVAVTALSITDVTAVNFNVEEGVAEVTHGSGKVQSLALNDTSAVTVTVVEGVSLLFTITNA